MTTIQYYLGNMPILLGKKIGRGGEGEVYLASNYPGTAVKIYTDHKNTQRESKVSSMVKYKLADKTSLVSFPKGVIRTKEGLFVGFTMNLVAEHRPLHQVYGPKSRKIHFPKADFRFLIRVATNIARAVGQVHQSPCVIGDINESGILVSKNATVAIIDADSFQFEENGKQFPCLVGVPGFTPPELQGKSLNGVVRTKHHDYFGLAIAIFQLLFMGRHPYAGRHPDQNISPEQAIAKNLFAYSCLRKTQMTPPPFVPTLDDFPSDIANAFECAFGINPLSRPSPSKWVEILKRLESKLSRCTENPIHYYPSNGKSCPWCRMELTSGATLFAPSAMASITPNVHSNCSIDTIWADIESISIPQLNTIQPVFTIPSIVSPSLDAQNSMSSMQYKKIFSVLGVIAAVIAWFYVPTIFFVWVIIIFCIGTNFSNISDNNFNQWIDRYKKLNDAFFETLDTWQKNSGITKLYEIRSSLENAANEFRRIPELKSQALRQFMLDHRNNQLTNYLDQHLLNNASIPGIGPSKKVVLASFGIESAADIKQSEILKIPGFGQVTTEKLLEWRAGIETKCVYNSTVTSKDIEARAKIENMFNKQASALLKRLSSGSTELRQILLQVQSYVNNGNQNLNQLALARTQLEVDLKFLSIPQPTYTFKHKQSTPLVMGSRSTAHMPQKPTIHATNSIKCPQCGSVMVRRTARKKRKAFWGCSTYPRCRATKP